MAKQVADFITACRALIGFSLIWLGLTQGANAIPSATLMLIVDWTGDILDGKIARRSRNYYHSWLGDHDLEVDMAVAGGLLIYLLASGYVNIWITVIYVTLCALILWRWRGFQVLGMLSQAPIYAWFIWIAVHEKPEVGRWLIIWLIAAIILTWPQFPKQTIPGFLSGMRKMLMNLQHDDDLDNS